MNTATASPATVTAETENYVTVTTDAGTTYNLPYYSVPEKYGVGAKVTVVVEPATQTGAAGATYVAAL